MLSASVQARPISYLRPDELSERADAVVVASPVRIEKTGETGEIRLGESPPLPVAEHAATLDVKCVIKGRDLREIEFRYAPVDWQKIPQPIVNGPSRIALVKDAVYVFYLKKADGDGYVSVLDGEYDDFQAATLIAKAGTGRTGAAESAVRRGDTPVRPAHAAGPGITIAPAESLAGEAPAFDVTVWNGGEKDVVLNLGTMVGNGKVLVPDAIQLTLVDGSGNSKTLRFSDKRNPGRAGRVDDYLVPLRAGSTYTIALSLNDFWCPDTTKFQIHLEPGEYRIQASLVSAAPQYVNTDMEGVQFMNVWNGTVESEAAVLQVR
ncbi:MAG: hypothetical protein JXR94_08740 [Candidatus Hydrogenedentes bacterium]|nr:hypothetical protein [Candidatus Hydrogenedentota bacterium]